jgi:hypothetical protein
MVWRARGRSAHVRRGRGVTHVDVGTRGARTQRATLRVDRYMRSVRLSEVFFYCNYKPRRSKEHGWSHCASASAVYAPASKLPERYTCVQ